MPRRPDVEHFPAGVIDNEEHIQRLEEDRLDAKEVAGPYRRGVLLEEPAPTWRWFPIPRTTHILCDAPSRNLEAQPHQLRLDPPLAPEAALRTPAPPKCLQLSRARTAAAPRSPR